MTSMRDLSRVYIQPVLSHIPIGGFCSLNQQCPCRNSETLLLLRGWPFLNFYKGIKENIRAQCTMRLYFDKKKYHGISLICYSFFWFASPELDFLNNTSGKSSVHKSIIRLRLSWFLHHCYAGFILTSVQLMLDVDLSALTSSTVPFFLELLYHGDFFGPSLPHVQGTGIQLILVAMILKVFMDTRYTHFLLIFFYEL